MTDRTIAQRCDRLVEAFQAQGRAPESNLKPPLSLGEIEKFADGLGLKLPPEVVELYRWHNGVDQEDDDDVLLFRDNVFLSLDRACEVYHTIQRYYQSDPQVDLSSCFPIASFEGSSYVVACGQHSFGVERPHPVVLVFQGIEMHFHSLASMLDTCIDWVSHPAWDPYQFPLDLERAIWQQHNPGIFGGGR